MIYLSLSILSSVTIAVMLKLFEQRGRERMVLLAGNYFVAALISGGVWLAQSGAAASPFTIPLGAINGVLFVLGFFLYMRTIGEQGVAVAVSIMRLSVAIPVLASILVFGERPSSPQIIAIFLSGIAVLLLAGVKNQHARAADGSWLAPAALFLCIGLSDTVLKLFETISPSAEKGLFLLSIFATATFICAAVLIIRRIPVRRADLLRGLVVGIPNQLSSLFMVLALQVIDGAIAFPIVNISIMTLSSLLGVAVWRERLGTRGWAGAVIAVVSVWLMVQ